MRRFCAVLLISALLSALVGCGEKEMLEDKISEMRSAASEAAELGFTAEVTTDLGGTEFSCVLDCRASGGRVEMEITQPELIAGLKAVYDGESASLEFDGAEIAIGLSQCGHSPLTALPLLLDTMLEGYFTRVWTEKSGEDSLIAAEAYINEETTALMWFSAENAYPAALALVIGGKAVVKCNISDFSIS